MSKYIDIEKIKGNTVFPYFGGDGEKRKVYREGFYRALQCVEKEAEAEDVAPVIHGKNIALIYPADGFICSECRFEMSEYVEVVHDDDGEFLYREFEPKFCPNCGARMDGKEGEENA